jgi:chorismate dehydratase
LIAHNGQTASALQINWKLSSRTSPLRICAVNFLNTVPLVWGLLNDRGSENRGSDNIDLSFALPSVCSDSVASGRADIGLVPLIEIARQGLEIVPGVGICCEGPVRSILLVSRVPFAAIRTLAADSSSRTSVQLARLILRERYGAGPAILEHPPALDEMLAHADAGLIIGDPALRLDPAQLPYETLDLGADWHALTGLPMVFAAWAGKPSLDSPRLERLFTESYEFGRAHLDDILSTEPHRHGVSVELARRYLTGHIHFRLGAKEYRGMNAFLELAGFAAQHGLAAIEL